MTGKRIVAIILGILAASWAALQAGGPRERHMTGKLARVFNGAEQAVILTSDKGIAQAVMKLGHGCLVTLNGQRATAEELRAGLIATIHFNDYTRVITRLEAQSPPFILEGALVRLDLHDGALRVEGMTRDTLFAPEVVVFADGKFAYLRDLKLGQRLAVLCDAPERNGLVQSIDKEKARLYFEDSKEPLYYEEGYGLFRRGEQVFIAQIEKGDTISARKHPFRAAKIFARTLPKKVEKTDEKDMTEVKDKGDK